MFGGLEAKKLFILTSLENLDKKGMVEGLNEDGIRLKSELEMDFNRLLSLEEISWRQKSRATWLK